MWWLIYEDLTSLIIHSLHTLNVSSSSHYDANFLDMSETFPWSGPIFRDMTDELGVTVHLSTLFFHYISGSPCIPHNPQNGTPDVFRWKESIGLYECQLVG